jgi:hypothetical protein
MLDQTEKVTGETIKQSYRAVIPGSGASLLGILIQIRIKVRDGTGSPSKSKFWSYMGSKWSHVGQRTLKMEPWKSVDQWLQIRITSIPPMTPYAAPLHTVYVYTVYFFTQGRGGGANQTREKV